MNKKYIIFIIVIGCVLYLRALFNGFVWDDEEQIINNVAVHSLASIPSFLAGSTFNTGGTGQLGGVYYRPVMMILFTLLYAIAGPHAWVFHAFQIALHIGAAVLLYYVFKKFFPELLSCILSVIFLIHPANVESVAYIAALQDVIYVFFSLLCLVVYLYAPKHRRTPVVIGSLFILSMLSKEVALLFLMILIGYMALTRERKLVLYILLAGLSIGIYLLLRFAFAQVFFTPFHFAPIVNVPFMGRAAMVPIIFFSYMRMFFWPDMLAVMQHWVVRDITAFYVYLPAAGIAAIAAGLIYTYVKTRSNTFLFFAAWFLIGLAPYMQLFPLDMTVAERWFYFPMIGLLGLIGFYIRLIPVPKRNVSRVRNVSVVIVGVLCIALAARTGIRIGDWYDGYSLFTHDIQYSKNAFDLENNVGVAYFRSGEMSRARRHFLESGRLAPAWWVNWNNVGATYDREGDSIHALTYYQRSLQNGDYYLAYENYAGVLIKLKRYKEAREFLTARAMRIFPYNPALREMYDYVQTASTP